MLKSFHRIGKKVFYAGIYFHRTVVSHSSIRLQGSSSKWGENGLLIKHEVFLHFPHPDCLLRRIVPSLNVTRSTHPLALRYPS